MKGHSFRYLILCSTSIAIIAAFFIMMRWWLSYEFSSPVSTKLNTAICLFLLGIQILLIHFDIKRLLRDILGYFTLTIALLSTIEYFTGIQLAIDTLFFFEAPRSSFHLMSLATALSIIGLTISNKLLTLKKSSSIKAGLVISYLVGANSLIVLLTYLFGVSSALLPAYLSTESFTTAMIFILLVLSISLEYNHLGLWKLLIAPSKQSNFLRRLLISYLVIILMVSGMVLTFYRSQIIHTEFAFISFSFSMIAVSTSLILLFGKKLNLAFQRELDFNDLLTENLSKLDLAVEAARLGIWEYDVRKNIVNWNKNMYQIYETEPSAFDGSVQQFRAFVLEEDLMATDSAFANVMGGASAGVNFRILTAKNEIRYIQSTSTPITNKKNEIIKVLGINLEVTDYEITKNQLEKSNQLNENLLIELNHRVKNNLQLINSLLIIRSRQVDKETGEFLMDTSGIIRSFSTIHEQLLENQGNSLSINKYITLLCENLIQTNDGPSYSLNVDIIDEQFDSSIINSIGIIVNEIVTNIIKYAYPSGQGGPIHIQLKRDSSSYVLKVGDEGIGMNTEPNTKRSFGSILIEQFTSKLEGAMNIDTSNGTVYTITFPAPEK